MANGTVTKDEVICELQHMKEQLHDIYGVTRIGVFGSIARGESKPGSDLDIVVEMEPNLYKRAELREALELRLGNAVDVIRYREGMNSRLKSRIDKEAQYV